jgi:putative phosphoesterase
MVYGVISDTHGSFTAWKKALDGPFSGVDRIIHGGDVFYHGTRNPLPEGYDTLQLAEAINLCTIPVVIAMGNCDSEVDQMVCNVPIVHPFLVLDVDGARVMVQHWQHGGVAELDELMERFYPHVFVTGHTHVPEMRIKGETLILNPGSPSLTKRPDGKRTVAKLELTGDGTIRASLLDVDSQEVLDEITM